MTNESWEDGFGIKAALNTLYGTLHTFHVFQDQSCSFQYLRLMGTLLKKTTLPLSLFFCFAFLLYGGKFLTLLRGSCDLQQMPKDSCYHETPRFIYLIRFHWRTRTNLVNLWEKGYFLFLFFFFFWGGGKFLL